MIHHFIIYKLIRYNDSKELSIPLYLAVSLDNGIKMMFIYCYITR